MESWEFKLHVLEVVVGLWATFSKPFSTFSAFGVVLNMFFLFFLISHLFSSWFSDPWRVWLPQVLTEHLLHLKHILPPRGKLRKARNHHRQIRNHHTVQDQCREASKFYNKVSQYHINLISVTNSRGNTTKNLMLPGSQQITWRFFERFHKPVVT